MPALVGRTLASRPISPHRPSRGGGRGWRSASGASGRWRGWPAESAGQPFSARAYPSIVQRPHHRFPERGIDGGASRARRSASTEPSLSVILTGCGLLAAARHMLKKSIIGLPFDAQLVLAAPAREANDLEGR